MPNNLPGTLPGATPGATPEPTADPPSEAPLASPGDLCGTFAGSPAADLSSEARAYAIASQAGHTRRAYAAQLRLWLAHAEAAKRPAFPADPADVANWLAARAQRGQAYATLRTAIAAVRAGHVAQGLAFDTRAPAIELVMRGIGRTHARAQRQAAPLRGRDVTEILAGLGRAPIDLRDGALIAIAYLFALRRSELVALDAGEHGAGDGFVTVNARTIDLVLVRSKTARAGEVERVSVPRGTVTRAVEAIERWISAAGVAPGTPLLRSITKGGVVGDRLHPQSVPGILQRRIAEHLEKQGVPRDTARTEAARFSGHSLRVGFAVTAAEAGATADEIALVTRHRSLEMPRRYARGADALRRSPYRRPGVGTDQARLHDRDDAP
ncbi:MAG: tyrosine-type recombinase/integrase [Hyphomicrobiaceae bacterium]